MCHPFLFLYYSEIDMSKLSIVLTFVQICAFMRMLTASNETFNLNAH